MSVDRNEYDDEGHMSTYARCMTRCAREWRGRVPFRMTNRWIGGYNTHNWLSPKEATPDDH